MGSPQTRMIRVAKPRDAEAIARVHIDAWREAYAGIVDSAHMEGFSYEDRAIRWRERLEEAQEDRKTIVWEDEGDIAGWLTFGSTRDSDVEGSEIIAINIAPSHWRKGIGAALIGWAETSLGAREPLFLWVLEENQRARAFYARHQFEHDGTTRVVDIGRSSLIEFRYRKRWPLH